MSQDKQEHMPPTEGKASETDALLSTVAELEKALGLVDQFGQSVAAAHLSHAIELLRLEIAENLGRT